MLNNSTELLLLCCDGGANVEPFLRLLDWYQRWFYFRARFLFLQKKLSTVWVEECAHQSMCVSSGRRT
jgi:hypothetical protein